MNEEKAIRFEQKKSGNSTEGERLAFDQKWFTTPEPDEPPAAVAPPTIEQWGMWGRINQSHFNRQKELAYLEYNSKISEERQERAFLVLPPAWRALMSEYLDRLTQVCQEAIQIAKGRIEPVDLWDIFKFVLWPEIAASFNRWKEEISSFLPKQEPSPATREGAIQAALNGDKYELSEIPDQNTLAEWRNEVRELVNQTRQKIEIAVTRIEEKLTTETLKKSGIQGAEPSAGNLIRQRGVVWEIRYKGRTKTFENMRGLAYIQTLWSNPKPRFFTASELIGLPSSTEEQNPEAQNAEQGAPDFEALEKILGEGKHSRSEIERRGNNTGVSGSGGDLIADPQFLSNLDKAIEKWQEDKRRSDTTPEQKMILDTKIEDMEKWKKTCIGLKGKPRVNPDENQKNYQSVQKAISRAAKKILSEFPELKTHLDKAHVHTGGQGFWYEPPENDPEPWII